MSPTEILVSVLVMALVLYAMWRVGQLNPVGTGRLAQRLNQLELRVGEIDQRMDGIEKSVVLLADSAKTTSNSIEAMRIELAGDRGLTERTWAAVDRIQHFFIEQGLKGGK